MSEEYDFNQAELEHYEYEAWKAEQQKNQKHYARLQAETQQQRLNQIDQKVTKEVMFELGLTQEDAIQFMQENPKWAEQMREANIRFLGKKIADKKKGKATQPKANEGLDGFTAPTKATRPTGEKSLEVLEKAKEKVQGGRPLSEDEEVDVLMHVLKDF